MFSQVQKLEEMLARIEFKRPDGPYNWKVTDMGYTGVKFQLVYIEPDSETGQPELQETRPWYFENDDFTFEEVVKTAWACITMSDEHRRREWLLVDGKMLFSPHNPLNWSV